MPDEKTVWLYRELLVKAGAIEKLFARFEAALEAEGYLAMSGQIFDASLVAAPKQRNSDGEKEDLKEGRVPKAWKAKPAKLRQKDRDARWTLKQGKKKPGDGKDAKFQLAIPHYGYKKPPFHGKRPVKVFLNCQVFVCWKCQGSNSSIWLIL